MPTGHGHAVDPISSRKRDRGAEASSERTASRVQPERHRSARRSRQGQPVPVLRDKRDLYAFIADVR